ncbi:hypothetical protein BJX61DRAFT_496355 [Aspergillus egyptiacus]|nr:hypothetical protein BJX61DRAFT_496355 [Aspergillus egyptiacus]
MLSQLVRQKSAASQLRLLKGRSLLQSSARLRHNSHTSSLPALQSKSTSNNPQESRRRRPSFQSNRSLATAVDQSALDRQSSVPFENNFVHERDPRDPWNPFEWHPLRHELDPSSLVIIDDSLQTQPRVLRKSRGIGGDEEEMMANLDIALRVRQFDRATSLINRLRAYHPVGSPRYLELHNRYLEAFVSHIIVTRQQNLANQVQRWFEVDMPYGGVDPDATTLAIMIRMALRVYHGTKRDRMVRRYWTFAKGAGLEEEVLAAPTLSELELGELSEILTSDLQRVAIDSIEPNVAPTVDEVPAVRPVDQKGLGLSSLKESISVFSEPREMDPDMDANEREFYNKHRQEELESSVMQSALSRWRQEHAALQKTGPSALVGNPRLTPLLQQWHTDMVERINEELKLIEKTDWQNLLSPEEKERSENAIFLRALEPESLAALTILSVANALVRTGFEQGIKVARLITSIGGDMNDEIIVRKTIEKQKKAGANERRLQVLREIFAGRKQKTGWAKFQHLAQEAHKDDETIIWDASMKGRIGAALLRFLFDVARVPVVTEDPKAEKREVIMHHAFNHSYEIVWGRRQGIIHPHPELVKLVSQEPASDLLGRHLPMVAKPKPWTGYSEGAYYLHQNTILRVTPGETLQTTYIKAALENNGLERIREGLDILGQTGWVINRQVFDVMLEAWNSGDPIASLAPLEPDLPHPPKPSPEEGFEAEVKWNALMRDIENRRGGYHSQRCFQNFQLEVARAYLNETFYFPHNLDFRGRAYPLPPYLNQMGADNARGLLLFSEAKPLGHSGLRWLKIHLANLYGYDKASLSEREQFTMDHLDDVLDSANNGLHGRRWWLEAGDPWQCLAACCELRNALQYSDPTEYPSRLPIHQDGSCNGLQHYAALGGDKAGAQQVNLEPSDRPSDVYSGVADFVRAAVENDALMGDPTAKMLQGKITRKVVKQTVMTNVYGVTFLGAMKQVRKQLADLYPDLPKESHNMGSKYITKKIFEALGTMFNGAHDIQYWLGDCASRITQSLTPAQIEAIAKEALSPTKKKKESTSAAKKNKKDDPTQQFRATVIWTTPLGLPVVQPYRNRMTTRISTSFQGVSVMDRNSQCTVSKRKQLQAFPPNFIHSLDATHMMLSASACRKAGLTFSAVHDSFWTHARDVDTMNRVLREAFVLMHSDDVIKRLASEFKVRYGQNLFYARLSRAHPIAKAIREHRKAEGVPSRTQELLEEYKRQKLLKSDDPELQVQGREMVTPASIFEKMGGTNDDLSIKNSLGAVAVGHVPEDVDAAAQVKGGVPSGLDGDLSDPAIQTLLGSTFDHGLEMSAEDGSVEDAEAAEDADEVPAPKKKKKVNTKEHGSYYIHLWLPLTFREVPQKGEWDITRIRNSEYFFS